MAPLISRSAPSRWRSTEALGRVLAEDVVARRTQPPFAVSAMDGYAVRAADVASVPAQLQVVGAVPAGQAYDGTVEPGEAVRIFTGAPVPRRRRRDRHPGGHRARRRHRHRHAKARRAGRYVRPAGLDFREGAVGLQGRAAAHRARHRPGRGDEPALAAGASPAARRHPADRRRGGDARRSGRPQPDRQLQRLALARAGHGLRRRADPAADRARRQRARCSASPRVPPAPICC